MIVLQIHAAARKAAALLLSGSVFLASLPPVPIAAEEPLALRIAKVEVDAASLGENRLVSVEVRLDGNENGFIASEFGIAFDERLTLSEVRADSDAGRSFSYYCVPENHMVWFSGASGDAVSSSTTGRGHLFTLDFILPEQYAERDTYFIGYDWSGVDGESAFWYTAPGVDQLTSLMTYSVAGAITIPDPTAPKLNRTEVTINRGTTFELTVQNVDEQGVWFSDDESIATVKDGVITAIAPGSCTVSVFYTAASALLSCEVNVSSEYRYSMLDDTPVTITSPDEVVWLDYPGTVGSVQWVSTNPDILTVDGGKLSVHGEGVAQVIATNNSISKMKIISIQFTSADPSDGDGTSTSTTTTTTTTETTTSITTTTETTTTETSTETTTTTAITPSDDDPSTGETGTEPVLTAGDLNGDGTIDIVDVIGINKFLLGSVLLSDAQRKSADVYHDNVLDSTDALTLLKYVVALVDTIPVEP